MYEQNISKMLSLKPMINVKTLKSWRCVKKALKHGENTFAYKYFPQYPRYTVQKSNKMYMNIKLWQTRVF